MKLLFACMLIALTAQSQTTYELNNNKWRMDRNKYITGGLVLLGGAAKGFNETLQFHWKSFHASFPKANPSWFNPAVSWRNKYENDDPNNKANFPLSTSVLVFLTDQYHLNNFVNKGAITAALVIKIGEKKKRFGYYVKDFLFYTACYQAGWSLTYLPFKYKKQ